MGSGVMASDRDRRLDRALVVVGHGSTGGQDAGDPAYRLVEELRRRRIFAEVAPAFCKAEPSLREVIDGVGSEEVYVVPNCISEWYFTTEVIPRELGLEGRTTRRGRHVVYYCDPVGTHPAMAGLVLGRAAEVAPGLPPGECSLLVVGHGTRRNTRSRLAIERLVPAIRGLAPGYAEVCDAYMEEAPLVGEWDRLTTAPNVVVVPMFIAEGRHACDDVPVLLGIKGEPEGPAARRDVFLHNPHSLRGRHLYYAHAVGTDPRLADVILDQVAQFDRTHRGADA